MNPWLAKWRRKNQWGAAALLGLLLLASAPAAMAAALQAEKPLRIFGAGRLTKAALSPDGTRLLTGSQDGVGRLWDAADGRLLQTFYGHTNEITAVAFAPDGRQVLTGSGDSVYTHDYTARLWDAATGRPLRVLGDPADRLSFAALAFSPDGKLALTGAKDGKARLWDLATGGLLRTLDGHVGTVGAVAFSRDGKRALTGGVDSAARLWDVATGQALQTFSGHQGWVTAVALSADGARALTGSTDQTARLWDAASGQLLKTFSGHAGAIQAAALSPDGKRALTGAKDNTARLWDAAGGQALKILTGHAGPVNSVAFTPDGARMMTASGAAITTSLQDGDNTVRLWETVSGRQLRLFAGHSAETPRKLAFSPDGRKILVSYGDHGTTLTHQARLLDAATGATIKTYPGYGREILTMAFSPDGTKLLTGSTDGATRLFSVGTGALIRTFQGDVNYIAGVDFSADARQVFTGCCRGETWRPRARVWETATGKELRNFPISAHGVNTVRFSPDKTLALTCGELGVFLYDLATGQELRNIRLDTQPGAVAFLPDSKRIVTGSDRANAQTAATLWSAATGQALRTFVDRQGRSAGMVAISPDGKRLLTGGISDGRSDSAVAKLWEVSNGQELEIFSGHVGGVGAVAFSPDGRRVLTSSVGTVRLWAVDVPPAAAERWKEYE